MTQQALTQKLSQIAAAVLADPRWRRDDLSVSILGMILYGYALAVGRTVMFLDMPDIDAAVLACMTTHVCAAPKWSGGMVAAARASAFNEAHHPGNHELIGVGHSYFGIDNQSAIVDNVFSNIANFRNAAKRKSP